MTTIVSQWDGGIPLIEDCNGVMYLVQIGNRGLFVNEELQVSAVSVKYTVLSLF